MNENMIFILILTSSSVVADYMWYKIPNSMMLWGFVSSIVLHILSGTALVSLISGLMIPIILLFPVYLVRGGGAGDIKLLCVAGSIAGAEYSMKLVVSSFLIAGTIGLIKLIYLFILRNERKEVFSLGNTIHYSYGVLGGVFLLIIIK